MPTDSPMSILLIEDDEIDADSVRRSLPRQTLVQHATTLNDAIESAKDPSLDLILLDPGLPDSSGVDSFLRIRQTAPRLPIVILTGLKDRNLAVQIIRMGAQDYLLKNQLDERAVQALKFAVERGRLLQQLEIEQTERERLSEELREQEQSLAHLARVALMGELVAEISHEVSQPLSVISNLVAALDATLQQTTIDHELCGVLMGKLDEANSHAGDVLRRLREFIRDDSVQFESFDVNELIISTIEFVDYERRRRMVTVQQELSSGRLEALGNRTQIRQVIINLLRNAFDALEDTPQPDRLIVAATSATDDMIVVEITDHGSGLQLDAGAVFTAFKTTKSDGLGMGLAICARILDNHGGRISVAVPEHHPGSIFRFELPMS
ncbi:hybrid sensor histidine kinase/response regulator [Planctomycetes bacterium K23_9]|uniref:histidine kinase n=1 Tax=Stieleria marina TaxID=1930275 RepID=A0A517NUS7_9BACT|nr:Sensor protein FixL [Planctomycetes bacterium K23_9]